MKKKFFTYLRETETFKIMYEKAKKYLKEVEMQTTKRGTDIHEVILNVYLIKTRKVKYEAFYAIQSDVRLIKGNVEEMILAEKPKLLIADPPWDHLNNNPTRGVVVQYETLKYKRLCI